MGTVKKQQENPAVINRTPSAPRGRRVGVAGGARVVSGVMRWQPLRRQRQRQGVARLNLEPTHSLAPQEVSATKLMRQAG